MTAKTNTERSRAFRERKAAEQQTEVRGIMAHVDDHAAVKAAAVRVAQRLAQVRATQAKE